MALCALVLVAAVTLACAPEVGSEPWCEEMRETPKGDWSANDALAFAEHCVL
jgi:hypothetical protein